MLKRLAAAGLLLSAITLAAPADAAMYGSSSSSNSSATTMSPMMTTAAPWHRAKTSKGTIWVDSRGFALYTFDKDPAGKSTCYGACAVAWPPFRAGMGSVASGKWTIVHRMGMFSGQWAYKGKPLYAWSKDGKPGDKTGDGMNSVWHVAKD